jgi:hypothetical protein
VCFEAHHSRRMSKHRNCDGGLSVGVEDIMASKKRVENDDFGLSWLNRARGEDALDRGEEVLML